MLTITVRGVDLYDEEKEEFVTTEDYVLNLEHSLVSLSKWESKFEKPFLTADEKTPEEVFGYIEAMILNDDVTPDVLARLSQENLTEIMAYMDAKMTATWFNESVLNGKKSREVITNELIYYWMIGFQIDFEPAETWHLSRLFTLIKVCNAKNSKPKKQSPAEMAAERQAINEQNRARLGTRG